MDLEALFRLECGLYLLSAKGEKDNACIINTVMQVTANPVQICTAVNKSNYTHDIITETGLFNVSVLTQKTPFSVYSDFGYRSGRQENKFKGRTDIARSENGIYYLTENSNAFLSAKVKRAIGLESHTLFLAEVTEAAILSNGQSVSYGYYQKHVKPQETDVEKKKKKGYICTVCGYVYEGDTLPEDYVCPVCKHGIEAFKPL